MTRTENFHPQQDLILNFNTSKVFWFLEGRLLIPVTSTIRHMILKDFHDSLVGGHAGIKRTLPRIAIQFFLERDYSRCATICEELYNLSTS